MHKLLLKNTCYQRKVIFNPVRQITFHFVKEETNFYTILGAKPSMKQKEIKKEYYKMAKKYHPDFIGPDVSDKQKEEASEMFKKVQKAYECLSNPIARQAYDIENNIHDGPDTGNFDENRYDDELANKTYFQPKQQKDFYYTKWTNY